MGRHIFVVMATIALFGRARQRGVGLRHKKVRHACTGLGAGGSYGSGMGGSSIDGGGLMQVEGVLLAQPVLPSRLKHGSCRKATPASRLLCRRSWAGVYL
jgi:hypothetical protein